MSPIEQLEAGSKLRQHKGFSSRTWIKLKQNMDSELRERLRKEFPAVATKIFDRTSTDYWLEWLSDENLDSLTGLVLVFDQAGQIAGWVAGRSFRLPGSLKRVFYASSAGTRSDAQGGGIATAAWMILIQAELLRAFPSRLYVVMRTANPVVYRGWSRAAGGDRYTFPRPSCELAKVDQRVAIKTAEMLGQSHKLNQLTLVVKNAYEDVPGGLWDDRPQCGEHAIDEWFDRSLGPEDAFLLLLHFDSRRLLKEQLTKTLKLRAGGLRLDI